MKTLAACFVVLIAALRGVCAQEVQRPGESAPNARASIAPEKLSDDQLRQALNDPDSAWPHEGKRDRLLTEVIRRGGEHWERELRDWILALQERLDARRAKTTQRLSPSGKEAATPEGPQAKRPDLAPGTLPAPPGCVELMTAIRRLQKKPDPLQVLALGKRSVWCKFDSLPQFQVLLINLDADRQPVAIQAGGDYRSGRQARWRIVVRDAKGRELPEKPAPDGTGGGFTGYQTLEYGESWTTHLNTTDYLEIDRPGDYRVEILYHDRITIADRDKIEGLIVCKSPLMSLHVEPVDIELGTQERRAMRRWIANLPTKGPVKLLSGSYAESVHNYIPPDSSCGRLLAAGWKAVPDLIDAALDPELHPVRRAQVLALLTSITCCNDPRQEFGVLGSYECRASGWREIGGQALSRSEQSVSAGEVDAKAALKFAQRWRGWKDNGGIRVTTTPEADEKPPSRQTEHSWKHRWLESSA